MVGRAPGCPGLQPICPLLALLRSGPEAAAPGARVHTGHAPFMQHAALASVSTI